MDRFDRKQNIIAIIQARMSSSRLPGKVLADIGGKPMLARVVDRTRRTKLVNAVVVATTTDASDDPVETYCRENQIACFRGDPFDVLDRYYQAAKKFQADVIVRLTADCPVIDPQVIDQVIDEFSRKQADFAANRLPPPWKRTYPIGLDTEVATFAALERAWTEADKPYEREHVMPYLYAEPGRFKTVLVNTDPDYGEMRWTVDTRQDLEALRRIFAAFDNRDDFSWLEVLELVKLQPEIMEINANIPHKKFDDVDQRFLQKPLE